MVDIQLIKNTGKNELILERDTFNPFPQNENWQTDNYRSLLNQQELMKGLKRNLWKYELRPMINGFMSNLKDIKQEVRFKISGKILNTSTYVLKTKTNRVINNSIETQEDIKDAQLIEEFIRNMAP